MGDRSPQPRDGLFERAERAIADAQRLREQSRPRRLRASARYDRPVRLRSAPAAKVED
jgi:hypothetical protein